jgi:hypothetical protein
MQLQVQDTIDLLVLCTPAGMEEMMKVHLFLIWRISRAAAGGRRFGVCASVAVSLMHSVCRTATCEGGASGEMDIIVPVLVVLGEL